MDKSKQNYKAPALEKGLDILELLSCSFKPLTKQQISTKLNRSLHEIFRMLVVLEERNYIVSTEHGYILSAKLFTLSNQYPPLTRLLEHAPNFLKPLCHHTLQSCHISILNEGCLVVIAQQNSPYKMGFSVHLSSEIDLCGSGSGLVALAYCSEPERLRQLNLSNASQVEKNACLSQIPEIIEKGYHLGASPQVMGLTNISYPILTIQNHLLAVITIPFLTLNSETVHHRVQSLENARLALAEVAKQLSSHLGQSIPKTI